MAEFTGHTPSKGDQVNTPGGNGTVDCMEGEQVTGILHRNGMPFSYHYTRVMLLPKTTEMVVAQDVASSPAAPSLLARAEAAEERVRVLEDALAGMLDAFNSMKADELGRAAVAASDVLIGKPLATTGVQHG